MSEVKKELKVYLNKNYDVVIGMQTLDTLEDVLVAKVQVNPQTGQPVLNCIPVGFPLIQELIGSCTKDELGLIKELSDFDGLTQIKEVYKATIDQIKHPNLILNGDMKDVAKSVEKAKKENQIIMS